MRTVATKLNEAEYALLKDIAAAQNCTPSSVLRQAFLSAKIEDKKALKKADQERLFFLNRLSNNINQIARFCNTKRGLDFSVLESLINIEKEIKKWY